MSEADAIQEVRESLIEIKGLLKNMNDTNELKLKNFEEKLKVANNRNSDLEDAGTTGKCSNKLIADMAEIFCNAIEKAGYWVGIYANTSWFTNKLTDNRFNKS